MPKGGPEIAGSQEVRNLLRQGGKPEQLTRTLAQHRQTLTRGVEQGKKALATAYQKLTSEHARSFLSEKASSIGNTLRSIASKGYEIIQKHRRKKEDEEAPEISSYEYQSVNYLSERLKTELFILKKEIPNFRKLQEGKESYKKTEEENTSFESETGLKSFDDLIAHYKKQQEKLQKSRGALPSSIDHPGGNNELKEFEEAIAKRSQEYEEIIRKYEESKKSYEENQKKVEEKTKKLPEIEKAVAAFEGDPNPENTTKLEVLKREMDMGTFGKEIFGENMHMQEGKRVADLYQDLWSKDFSELNKQIGQVKEKIKAAEALVPIRKEIEEKINKGNEYLPLIEVTEMRLKTSPQTVNSKDIEVFNENIKQALVFFCAAKKILNNTPELPDKYAAEKASEADAIINSLNNRRISDKQQEYILQEKYSEYITIVRTGSTEMGNLKSKAILSEAFYKLPKERQNEITIALSAIHIAFVMEVKEATYPKIMKNFWAGQHLSERGDIRGAIHTLQQFLEKDIKDPDFLSNPELLSMKDIYISQAKQLLEKLEAENMEHQLLVDAQELANKGDIYEAKRLAKQYLEEFKNSPEEDYYPEAAKTLLKKIALIQIQQVRVKLEESQKKYASLIGESHVVWAVRYLKALDNIKAKIENGEFLDFNDAFEKEAEKNPYLKDTTNGYNFLADELTLEQGRKGLLELARKYRKDGHFDLARQMFVQFFGEKLAEIKKTRLNYEKFLVMFDANPRFHQKLKELIEKDKARYDELCSGEAYKKEHPWDGTGSKEEYEAYAKRVGKQYAKNNPWDPAQARERIKHALYERMLPEETQKLAQSLYASHQSFFTSEIDREAWKEFADMEGLSTEGSSWKPFAISDARVDYITKQLSVELAVMAISYGAAGAARRVASEAVLRVGLRESGKIALEHGVIGTGRRLASYGVGVVAQSTVLTASDTVKELVANKDLDVTEELGQKWLKHLASTIAYDRVGRIGDALGWTGTMGHVGEWAIDVASEGVESGDVSFETFLSEGVFATSHITGRHKGHEEHSKANEAESLKRKKKSKETEASPINTHYRSEFSTNLNGRQGELGTDLKIRYNQNYLESFLPEGHHIDTSEGKVTIIGPDDTRTPLMQYTIGKNSTPEGRRMLAAMNQIKTHEEVHRLFGLKVKPETMTELMSLFATPDANGKVPEGKILLTDQDGKPVEINQKNVEEFIAYLGDGQLTNMPDTHRSRLENTLAKDIPNFTFSEARFLATIELGKARAEQLKRAEAMAREVKPAKTHADMAEDLTAVPSSVKEGELPYARTETRGNKPDLEATAAEGKGNPAKRNEASAAKPKKPKSSIDQFEADLKDPAKAPKAKEMIAEILRIRAIENPIQRKDAFQSLVAKHLDLDPLKLSHLSQHIAQSYVEHYQNITENYKIAQRRGEEKHFLTEVAKRGPFESLISEKMKVIETNTKNDYQKAKNKGEVQNFFDKKSEQGGLEAAVARSLMKREAESIQRAFSDKRPDGSKKTVAERKHDIESIRKQITDGSIGIHNLSVNALGSTISGRRIMNEVMKSDSPKSEIMAKTQENLENAELADFNHADLPGDLGRAIRQGELSPEATKLLAKDKAGLIGEKQVRTMLELPNTPETREALKVLEANIDNPKLSNDFVDEILKAPPKETTENGEKIHYYTAGTSLGEGGMGEFYHAAILNPKTGKLEFMGVKVLGKHLSPTLRKGEIEGARTIMNLINEEPAVARFFAKPLHIADNNNLIFFEVVSNNEGKSRNLSKMMEDPNTPTETILEALKNNFTALAILHRRGLIHGDYKPAQSLEGENYAKLTDYGTVKQATKDYSSRTENIQATKIDGSVIYLGLRSPGVPVTPLYYDGRVFDSIRTRDEQDKARGDTNETSKNTWKQDAYAAGVALHAAITGTILRNQARFDDATQTWVLDTNKDMIEISEGLERLPKGDPHRDPPIVEDPRREPLLKIARALMDPNDYHMTLGLAATKIDAILNPKP